jgi:hypothetical protein
VADNADTWPNRLEARLGAAGQPVEVINAGVGYYGPDELQRAGQALLRLRPARLIVAPYLGNDLLDAIVSQSREGGAPIPALPPRAERLAAMAERHPGAVHQALNQDLLLAEHPALLAPACDRLAGALRGLWAAAAGEGVELWVMPLPPLFDVAHPDAILADAESILGLPRAAVGQHRACAAGLEAAVRAGGPAVGGLRWMDVQPAILAVGAPAYWAADQHLSARGLDAVAAGGTDCDDDDNKVFPDADEVRANGVDDDCDGQTDERFEVETLDASCDCGLSTAIDADLLVLRQIWPEASLLEERPLPRAARASKAGSMPA